MAVARWHGWRAPLHVVQPATVLDWHRRGFRLFWTWKSRHRRGRPSVPADVRALIREMSTMNPLWGAPRIHGELQKLGIAVSQSTVTKYMRRERRPPSQTWRTFLTNHANQIMAADLFVVPTVTFRLLFVLVILAHDRRRLVHVAVTDHPTAAWTAQQLRNAFSENDAPRYLLHDRDSVFADVATTIAGMNTDGFARRLDRRGRMRTLNVSVANSQLHSEPPGVNAPCYDSERFPLPARFTQRHCTKALSIGLRREVLTLPSAFRARTGHAAIGV